MTNQPEERPPGLRYPETEDFPTGPDIGERLPDITLPDQHGNMVNIEETRGEHRALVVFHRSVRWWPFCRSQLVQLQKNLEEFKAQGIAIFAISYDRVEAQAAFAEEFGITFPLLADPDHRVIEETGILNTLVRPDEEAIYGVPFPGSFVVGTDGTIEEKLFFQHYRTRPSAATVLREGFGLDFEVRNHPHADVAGDGVRITATLAGESMVFMETSMLYIDIDLDEGLHLYGQPIPEGYIATEVDVTAPEGIVVDEPQYPATVPFHVEGIDDEFQAFEGDIRIRVPVHMRLTEAESFTLDVTVRYQACNDRECFLPQTRQLSFEVPIEGLNRQRRD